MGRVSRRPTIKLALSPAALATACDINPAIIYREILAGHLEVRQLPGSNARRIWIGPSDRPGTAEHWYRNHWLARPRNTKKREVQNG